MSQENENVTNFLHHRRLLPALAVLFLLSSLFCALGTAQQPADQNAAPDVLVLSNGDTLHGKLVSEAIAGDAGRFDVFSRIPHAGFPGGPVTGGQLTTLPWRSPAPFGAPG